MCLKKSARNKTICVQVSIDVHLHMSVKKLIPSGSLHHQHHMCTNIEFYLKMVSCNRTVSTSALMHWPSLLLAASSMGNPEYRRLLPLAPPAHHLMSCDVFLAPSTIPGSACMITQNK